MGMLAVGRTARHGLPCVSGRSMCFPADDLQRFLAIAAGRNDCCPCHQGRPAAATPGLNVETARTKRWRGFAGDNGGNKYPILDGVLGPCGLPP